MPAPVALQLYTLRDQLALDFEGGIRKVASIGYAGVEPAGFPGTTAKAAARLFRDLGMDIPSAHVPLPVGDKRQEVLDTMHDLGCTRLVGGFGPDQFKTVDAIKASCALFNEAGAAAKAHGLQFHIHNHWWEFEPVAGRPVYQHMLEQLTPDVLFEVDVYWVKTGGCDPVAVVKELGPRAPLLHIKDGACARDIPMTAVGEGIVDMPAVVQAGGSHTQWLIVELDSCATDMLQAVVKSYAYLTKTGLGRGRR